MAKFSTSGVLDGTLAVIGSFQYMAVLSGEPANVAAISGLTLASTSLTELGGGSPDYTLGNGAGGDRTLTLQQQDDISITQTGDATHIVVHDNSAEMEVTTCPSQGLSSGGTVTVPAIVYTAKFPV